MKTLFNSALPALALLALGGCATTGAVSSTEPDDVYYSSKDRTTYAAAPATSYQSNGYQPNGYGSASTQAQAPAGENANPDYQGGTAQQGSSTDYYDDNYTSYNSVQPSGFGQPYTGPGVSSYNYTPSWSVAPSFYGSPWGYGTGLSLGYGYGGFGGYSPFGYGYGYPAYAGFYDPFYSPFYSPWGWGYGSGLSIGFGYGFGGFGGFGYPYYGGFGSPYRYGYGYPGYAYGGGYGGGYYGGDYGYGRGGARNYVYKQGIMNGSYRNGYDPDAIKVGRRESRYADAAGSGGMVAPGTGAPGTMSNRRPAAGANSGFDRMAAPGGNPPAPTANGLSNNGQPATMDRRRFDQPTMNPNSPGAYDQPRTMSEVAPPAAGQPQRRGGFFREMFANPNPNGGQPQGQANGYAQPQQRNFDQQRAFSQPQQRAFDQQRSFQQPQQRTFEQPRMEQRSFSPAPSFGGGGGGGGSFGGGGGGGGRRGR